MIYDVRDPLQRRALHQEMTRHDYLYGNVFVMQCGTGLVMLIEPWINPVTAEGPE